MSDKHNIFISHYGHDDDHVQSLKSRLKDSGYDVRNYSIDSTKHNNQKKPTDKEVREILDTRIKNSGTFICLIGPETHKRKWVNYEIRKAYLEGKRIIGVYVHGCKDNVELPETYKRYGGPLIGWNSVDKIGGIISGENTPYENPNSTSATPIHSVTRIPC